MANPNTKPPKSAIRSPHGRFGLTLVETLVVIAAAVLILAITLPALTASREQAHRRQCAFNQKKIVNAYALWGQDHGGFWPPRCTSTQGCVEKNDVWILVDGSSGKTPKQEGTAYYAADPDARKTWPAIAGVPANANDADLFHLNTYLVPGWQYGDPLYETRCPSDAGTLKAAADMDPDNLADRGFAIGDIASAFEFFGTSYFYNYLSFLPWKGFGDWAGPVVTASNKLQGPNFNTALIHRPNAFVVGLDAGTIVPHWNRYGPSFVLPALGDRVIGAPWHEIGPLPTDDWPTWLSANAFHADGHVAFDHREHMIHLGQVIPFSAPQCFYTQEWSLFPVKLNPQHLSSLFLSICN